MHHRLCWALLLLSLSVACLRRDGAQRDIPPGPWAVETVDRLGDLGHGLSMAVDADGGLHLTYADRRHGQFIHAWRETAGWKKEVLAEFDPDPAVSPETSLVWAASGLMALLDPGTTGASALHARDDAGLWGEAKRLAGGVRGILASGSAIGAAGRVLAVGQHFEGDVCDLGAGCDSYVVNRHESGRWERFTLPFLGAGRRTGDGALLVDEAGVIHLFGHYRHRSAAGEVAGGLVRVRFARDGTAGAEEVDPTAVSPGPRERLDPVADPVAAAWGPAGSIHLAYGDTAGPDGRPALKYALFDGAAWSLETVDPIGAVGRMVAIAVAADGAVHIAYTNDTNHDLKLASKAPGERWSLITLDDSADVGEEPAVAITPDGTIHVAYRDLARAAVRHTWRPPGGEWIAEIVDTQDNTGEWPSLAVAADGTIHIAYRDAHPNYDLKHAWRPPGEEWQSERAYQPGNAGAHTSMVLAPDGTVAVAHQEIRQGVLLLSERGKEGWSTRPVTSRANVGSYANLIRGGEGGLHLIYLDHLEGDLLYSYRPLGGDWIHETVATKGRVGWGASLALDEAGVPWVSFHDASESRLLLASRVGGDWALETLPRPTAPAVDTSLAFDREGYAHILYYEKVDSDLRHAWRDRGGWHDEVVFAFGDAGSHNELAIAADGTLHTVFLDESGQRLLHGWRELGGWRFEVVDDQGEAGMYPSLAFAPDGRLMVAYQVAIPGWDLRLAVRDPFPP